MPTGVRSAGSRDCAVGTGRARCCSASRVATSRWCSHRKTCIAFSWSRRSCLRRRTARSVLLCLISSRAACWLSEGLERAARREFNEAVLDTTRPLHRLAGDLAARAHEEGDAILENARRSGTLTWDLFAAGWWRLVRRVVLGDGARDDHAVTDTLTRLRRDANWAYLKPRRRAVYRSLYQRLAYHIARAEPGSLASLIGPAPNSPVTAPRDQVAHWLFAFDAAGMASFTALALLDTHADYARRVRDALSAREPFASEALPLLSAAVLESCGSGRQPRPSFARRRRRRCGRTASCRAAPQSSSSRRSSTATPSGFPGPTASHRKSGSTVAAAGAGRSFPSAMVPPRVQAETSSCFSRARCWQRCWSAMSSARPRLGHWIAPAPCRRR
jgi:hypothetical protein